MTNGKGSIRAFKIFVNQNGNYINNKNRKRMYFIIKNSGNFVEIHMYLLYINNKNRNLMSFIIKNYSKYAEIHMFHFSEIEIECKFIKKKLFLA